MMEPVISREEQERIHKAMEEMTKETFEQECLRNIMCLNVPVKEPMTPIMPHAHALFEEAERTITGPRRGAYGDFTTEASKVAIIWEALRGGGSITARHVSLFMVALKLVREANAHKADNLVDIVGYTGLLAEMEGGR